ncbi:hypothetical protein [Litoribrevibacter albus]|uniref:Uncharacterized protein n=1 Tax=Litoribrevibacter albus TaxID=1473156 RepID=A0AA37W739_9GAMM|nr:hypothetical protein [Litoribrevibacter albus]GLQ30749.1 hypothetical protein GCM10007876_12280 [Litoribrevibacter albus]
MSQSIATHFISVNPHDSASIKNALELYTQLIRSGEAFRHTYCKYYFKFTQPVDWAQYPNQPLIKVLMEEGILEYPYKEETLANIEDVFTSETLLVLQAIQHDELYDTLVALAEVMRDRGRLMNNWYNLFIAESEFFGLYSLFIIALKYPQMGYLFTGFMPSADKYFPPSVPMLANIWAAQVGICEDSIKAWCYCDHPVVRNLMFASGIDVHDEDLHEEPINGLYAHLSKDDEAIHQLKAVLNERFVKQGFLPFEEHLDPYDNWGKDIQPQTQAIKPLHYFYYSLVARGVREFDGSAYSFDFPFLKTSVSEFADQHQQQLEHYLDEPLSSRIDPWAEQRKKIVYLASYTGSYCWSELLERGLSNGEAVWEYVIKGENPELLDSIPSVNLYKFSEDNYGLGELTDMAGIESAEDMDAKRFELVKDLIDDYMDCQIQEERRPDTVLRFFDVYFRLCGGEPLSDDIKTRLVDDYDVIDSDGFDERFRCEIEVNEAMSSLHDLQELFDEPNQQKLDKAYELICEHRRGALDWFEDLDDDRERYTFSCLVIGREGVEPEDADELHEECLDFVENDVVDALLEEMEGRIATNYLRGENETLCYQRWEDLKSFVYGRNTALTAQQAEAQMKPFYSPEREFIWDLQLRFEGAFQFEDEYYLLTAFWQLLDLPLKCAPALQRVLDCLIETEATHLVEALNDFYLAKPVVESEDEEDDDLDEPFDVALHQDNEKQLLAIMARLNIPAANYYAWVLDKRRDCWAYFAEHYGLPGYETLSLGIDESMHILDQYDRVRFLRESEAYAEERVEEQETTEGSSSQQQLQTVRQRLQEECFWALGRWLERSLATPEKRLYQRLTKEQQIEAQHQASDITENAKAYHAFMGSLTFDSSLADFSLEEMHKHLLDESVFLNHQYFMVQKQSAQRLAAEGQDYQVLTKPWLVEAMRTSSPLINTYEGLYPGLYAIDETVDPQAIKQMQQEVETGVFKQQVADVLAFIRGEKTVAKIKPAIEHATFMPLNYLPEYGENYSVEKLMEYLSNEQMKRLECLLQQGSNPGLMARFKRLFRR